MGLEALLVLLFFFLPGLIADSLYRLLRWMPEPDEGKLFVRSAMFSSAGLLLLIGLDQCFPEARLLPHYLAFDWSEPRAFVATSTMRSMMASWGIHVVASLVVGLALVWVMTRKATASAIEKLVGQSLFESAWQEFVRAHFNEWVRVQTVEGSQYYGRLGIVSGHADKAIVLWNPAGYQEVDDRALITVDGTKGIYLPEHQIAQIAVSVSDEEAQEAKNNGTFGTYDLSTGRKVA